MSTLTSLPDELLEQIISIVPDTKTLKALRVTCKRMGDFTTPQLFRTISLYNTPESCENLQSILLDPSLGEWVQTLNLNTVEDDYHSDEEDEEEPPREWKELLEQIPTFPNLQTVALRFDMKCAAEGVDPVPWVYAPQTEAYRATILRWLFAALSDLPRPLKELAILNHQNVIPISHNVLDWMDEVFSTLESLRLNVVHERDPAAPEHDIEKRPVHDFFTRVLRWHWLKPSMSSLRKLSLYSSLPWGFYPKFNMEDLYFPHLHSLTLGNFSFADDEPLNWILKHSATLKELYMDRCFILLYAEIGGVEDMLDRISLETFDLEGNSEDSDSLVYNYPRRWHDYFASIQSGLPHLSRFGFASKPSRWNRFNMPLHGNWNLRTELTSDCYAVFSGGFEWSPLDFQPGNGWPSYGQQDLDALRELQRVVRRRAVLN